MYLIDTNILSKFVLQKNSLNEKFEIFNDKIYISVFAQSESYFGAYKVANTSLIKAYDNLFGTYPVVDYNSECALVWAKIKANLSNRGLISEDFDLCIASQAIVNNLILVTNNTKHFQNIPDFKLEDWTK